MGVKRIDFDRKAIGRFLKGPEVAAAILPFGQRVGRGAQVNAHKFPGAEFSVKPFQGRDRNRVHIRAENAQARRAEEKDRALTRAKGEASR